MSVRVRTGSFMILHPTNTTFQPTRWLYLAWFQFIVRYRMTALGPAWLLVGPILFISTLGLLFARVGNVDTAHFIPHLTVGLIVWTLVGNFVTGSTTVFQRHRPQIMQGGMGLTDIVMVEVASTVIQFLHQVPIIAGVFLLLGVGVGPGAFLALPGLALLVLNGVWLTIVFGIIGARYRDLAEVVQAIMRIAFLATPIIWLPGDAGHGVISAFITFNPFYHFLEIVRAPLLGSPIAPLSWAVALSITGVGFALAHFFYRRYGRLVPLWV
jgi:ABC-2 type transport system permease protein/lipopolysaccharide transport system permease protein